MKSLKISVLFLYVLLAASCSIRQMAVKSVAGSLSSGGDAFLTESDPELVRDALPFALKMYEIILSERPDDPRLLLSTSRAFTMYAYGFLMTEAEMADRDAYEKAMHLRRRASGLFLRARDYALRGLELKHPGFKKQLRRDQWAALQLTDKGDVELLYWCGVSWAAALSAAKDDLVLLGELPLSAAMVHRVLELDESFSHGAAHDFFISYYGSRPEAMGGSVQKAREHFKRSLELSGGSNVGTYVAMATSVSIRTQDVEEFRHYLEMALSVDVDKYPRQRLSNVIMKRRARWLLENTEEFFLEGEP
jgi:predicted anti-sigma-YlaC factor YlaD